MSNDKKSSWQEWQDKNVRTGKDKVILRFLSNLADHHGKGTYWIRSQYPLYQRKFYNIPKDYLTKAFFDYLMNTMPSWLPTLPQVAETIYDRDDFVGHWHTIDLNEHYCMDCRSDRDGKEGGMRHIFYYGYVPSKNKIAEYRCVANCDCKLGKKNTRSPLHDTLNWLRRIDSAAEIHVSYWCEATQRHVDPKEEASITWRRRVDLGVLRYGDPTQNEDPRALFPCWEHPIWTGPIGDMMCKRYGFEMPPEVLERYNLRPRLDKKKRFEEAVKLRRKIGKDEDAPISAPKSLADLLGGS